MLDLGNEQSVIDAIWDEVELKPCLPDELQDFFDQHGTLESRPGCRRAYLRFYLRSKAILQWHEAQMGVYTADASRQGLCFLSPVQLLPKERCRIRLPRTKEFQIEVVRCRRIAEGCYECGAMFVLGAMPQHAS